MLRKKFYTFIHTPWSIKTLYIRSAFLILSVRMLLSLVSFRTVRKLLHRLGNAGNSENPVQKYTPAQIAASVKVASKNLLKKRPCLVQSLVLWTLYEQYGYTAEIRIGVRADGNDQIQGHAWVVHQKKIAIGWIPDLPEFAVLPSFDLTESVKSKEILGNSPNSTFETGIHINNWK